MIIAIDFDGTIVEDRFPGIGELKPGAVEMLKKLRAEGYYLILWTSRTELRLAEAVLFCAEAGILFDRINESCPVNIDEFSGMDTRKIFAHTYIDDRSLEDLPPWPEIYERIHRILPTREDKIEREGHI